MELTDLKYFIAIAKKQNLQQVAEDIHLSPSALSKSIARLEEELGKPLFTRVRQRLHLTEEGKKLQQHANLIVTLEQSAAVDIMGSEQTLNVRVAGPEACLLYLAPLLRSELSKLAHPIQFQFFPMLEEKALEDVHNGNVHLAIVCMPSGPELTSKNLANLEFHTYAGKAHPLVKQSRRSHPIEEVLKEPFATGDLPLFGSVSSKTGNFDGWRDDKFPRLIGYRTASLKLLEELVLAGEALAYLPEYYGNSLPLVKLNVTGCPYTCKQQLRLVAYRPELVSWLNRLF